MDCIMIDLEQLNYGTIGLIGECYGDSSVSKAIMNRVSEEELATIVERLKKVIKKVNRENRGGQESNISKNEIEKNDLEK